MNLYRLAPLVAVCALTGASIAQSPVGSWQGSLKVNQASMPKAKDAQSQKMTASILAMIQKMKFNLNLKGDKTWKLDVTGLPEQAGKGGQGDSGSWSQKGNQITIKSSKNPKAPPQVLTISKDGKTITMSPKTGGPTGTLTFKKLK